VYIEKIKIENVKLIRDQTISFLRDDKPRMWTVIVGENGTCKTTILQAIALAASGPVVANKLAEAFPFRDRRSERSSDIRAYFGFGGRLHDKRVYPGLPRRPPMAPRLFSWLLSSMEFNHFSGFNNYPESGDCSFSDSNIKEIEKSSGVDINKHSNSLDLIGLLSSTPLMEVRAKNLGHWFVAGYGPTRSLPLPKTLERSTQSAVERLSSLFSATRIIGTGFVDLLEDNWVEAYVRNLEKALTQQAILPRIKNLELRRKGGVRSAEQLVETHLFEFETGHDTVKVPTTWLSQGYQAMISWIADLIGQFFWDYGGPVELEDMEGLVLIDELDIHLHPTWQVGLIKALKTTFPRVQFVVTTHTAMVLPGLEADEVLRTRFDDEGNVVVEPVGQSPSLMTGSEILQTFFGIDRLFPAEVGEALQQYGYLASNPDRTDEEEAKLEETRALLRKEGVDPGWEPKPRNGRPKSKAKKGTKRSPRK
jgi:hypothetical protein